MAEMYRIDLTQLPSHKERYDLLTLMTHYGFDVFPHWKTVDPTHQMLDYLDVFWPENTEPYFPELPELVKIRQV